MEKNARETNLNVRDSNVFPLKNTAMDFLIVKTKVMKLIVKVFYLSLKEYKCKKFGATCDDGDCVDPAKICDGIFDCKDFSDEQACKFFFHRQFKGY